MEQMELDEDAMDEEINQEQDFHFVVSKMDDEDDMVDLSSDEGETEEFIQNYNISAEDDVLLIFMRNMIMQAALQMFFAPDTGSKRNLADLIMQKIEEKKQAEGEQPGQRQPLDPKIIEVYSKVAKILQQYFNTSFS